MRMGTTVLLGTTKGVFLLDSSDDRKNWAVRGPFCDGWPINHVIGDPATGTIWAAGGSDWHGAGVWRSDDHGASWALSQDGITAGAGAEPLKTMWSLGKAGDRIYAGAKPASLFCSDDQGASWGKVQALNDHPSCRPGQTVGGHFRSRRLCDRRWRANMDSPQQALERA
jgi:hypothetical protein